MKKIFALLLVAMLTFSISACSRETVTLSCDAEGCNNTIEKKVKKEDNVNNEDWIVYCEKCAEEKLSDKR